MTRGTGVGGGGGWYRAAHLWSAGSEDDLSRTNKGLVVAGGGQQAGCGLLCDNYCSSLSGWLCSASATLQDKIT